MLKKIVLNIIKHKAMICIALFCIMILYCLDVALSIKIDENVITNVSNNLDEVKGIMFVFMLNMFMIIIFWLYLFLGELALLMERGALRNQIRNLKDEIGYLETEISNIEKAKELRNSHVVLDKEERMVKNE